VCVCVRACTCTVYVLIPCHCVFIQHQQQVAAAVERAKQVTMSELNAIVGVSVICIQQYT